MRTTTGSPRIDMPPDSNFGGRGSGRRRTAIRMVCRPLMGRPSLLGRMFPSPRSQPRCCSQCHSAASAEAACHSSTARAVESWRSRYISYASSYASSAVDLPAAIDRSGHSAVWRRARRARRAKAADPQCRRHGRHARAAPARPRPRARHPLHGRSAPPLKLEPSARAQAALRMSTESGAL